MRAFPSETFTNYRCSGILFIYKVRLEIIFSLFKERHDVDILGLVETLISPEKTPKLLSLNICILFRPVTMNKTKYERKSRGTTQMLVIMQ